MSFCFAGRKHKVRNFSTATEAIPFCSILHQNDFQFYAISNPVIFDFRQKKNRAGKRNQGSVFLSILDVERLKISRSAERLWPNADLLCKNSGTSKITGFKG